MKKIDVSTPTYPNTYAIVDDDDYLPSLAGYKWSAQKCNRTIYVARMCRGNRNKKELLHRFIMNAGDGQIIDHADGNGLNCQKSNLRLCTHSQNMQNAKIRNNKTSKYKGVNWAKRECKWLSRINCNCKHIHIGYFDTEEDAAKAYDKKAIELFKEYAHTNFKIEVTK